MKRFFALLLAVLILICLVPGASGTAPRKPDLMVLFTHDTHDHFYPDANGVGGYTRLATALSERQEAASRADIPTVTVDAGDFSMGSLFQTIYATDAPELRALGAMGYDVVTLGNHEFDYRQQGLSDMLNAAKASGETLPQIVQANYTVPNGGDAPEALAKALADYPVTPYTVIEKADVKIGVFGVLGVDADECAPMSNMAFEPIADAAKRVVADLQKEGVDFVICLSHSGTEDGKGEDVDLAKAVDGIDLIISGHTHSTLEHPIVVNGTCIVSCGEYTQNLGVITLDRGSDTTPWVEYDLIPIEEGIAAHAGMESLAQTFQEKVDKEYLSDYNLYYDQVLAHSESDFTLAQTGDVIGTAYINTIKEMEGDAYAPIALAVAPSGVIRGAIAAGDVTTSQAFDILSLGSGADGSPGYPLVSIYLTGKDLKNVFEVDASISALMPAATLYGAGSFWRYNPNRMFLDKVTECYVTNQDGNIAGSIEDKKLYRVVADLYSGQMLGSVKEKSFGLLSITPRDKDGNEVTDFEEHIIHDGQGRELKAWQAFATYLESRETVEPVAVSKGADPSWNPVDLLFPMGAPTAIVTGLIVVILAAAILIVRKIVKKGRKIR